MTDFTKPPLTPTGDEINPKYWEKIIPSVNRCGDRILDLWTKYKHDKPYDIYKIEQCSKVLTNLMNVYGQVAFAVNVVIFAENLQAGEINAFNTSILSFYDNMDEDLVRTVESLRFINTKYQERKDQIMSELRGRGIAFKDKQ